MATALEIANLALRYVGDQTITAFTDANKRARACNEFWDNARGRALRSATWNCSKKRAQITNDATAPIFGWTYRYALPTDYVNMVSVVDAGPDWGYAIEDGWILTDLSPDLEIIYVYDDDTTDRFDPLLVKMCALELAVDLVEPLTQGESKAKRLMMQLEMAQAKAKGVDGRERPPQEMQAQSWVNERDRVG